MIGILYILYGIYGYDYTEVKFNSNEKNKNSTLFKIVGVSTIVLLLGVLIVTVTVSAVQAQNATHSKI